MAFYVDEGDVWKCLKHPSKRRRTGICPICLRDRLVALCPDCATVRPCSCPSVAFVVTTSSSSSSSSSRRGGFGRFSSLVDNEPTLGRSRSLSIPFLRSKSRFAENDSVSGGQKPPPPENKSKSSSSFSILSVFKSTKSKRVEGESLNGESNHHRRSVIEDDRSKLMTRSRSLSVPVTSHSERVTYSSSSSVSGKGRRWYFLSPVKVLRQLKASKVVQERSPLYRG